MSRFTNFPVTVLHPITDEQVEAEASFYFCPRQSYIGWDSPPEPPEVDLVDLSVNGESILNSLTEAQYRSVVGELLSIMVEYG